jgi:serine/threonine protein kinase
MPILTDQDRLGTTIGDGKYTLECILGRGGMGTVFEAIHTWTGRHVAVKLLLNEMALDVDASMRFLQEARSATAIEHPNVVEVLDMGRHDESSVYMVFELLRGESLADWLETNGPLDTMQAAMILLPVADALAAAHRLGIVHRDVKPDNIFLEDDGMGYVRPKLLDFGIACFSERRGGVARPGVIMGTPGYLSPEHAQGFHAGPASDVWSLGVVLFECITGYCPFESESLAGAILAIASHPVPSLRQHLDVPEPIADLIERTLVRDPTARFPDGAAFRDALAVASQIEFVPSRSRSVPPKIVRDSCELSLSRAHRVEVRQSSPAPASMPSVHPPALAPVPLGTPLSRALPAGVTDEPEAVTLRIDVERDDDGGDVEVSALLASLLPKRARFRRPAMFALLLLALLLVPMGAITYRPRHAEGSRAEGRVVAATAAGSAAGASGSTVQEVVPNTSASSPDAGCESSPSVAGVACAGGAATDSRAQAREPSGSRRTAPVDAGTVRVDAGAQRVYAGPDWGDAGAAPVDGGAAPVDAWTAPVDAGAAPVDSNALFSERS